MRAATSASTDSSFASLLSARSRKARSRAWPSRWVEAVRRGSVPKTLLADPIGGRDVARDEMAVGSAAVRRQLKSVRGDEEVRIEGSHPFHHARRGLPMALVVRTGLGGRRHRGMASREEENREDEKRQSDDQDRGPRDGRRVERRERRRAVGRSARLDGGAEEQLV